jgi:tetratricopeptide (TPR) repeat protein
VSDLQRYLDGRPVIAQPDSLAYRVSKLAKRNRWLIPVIAVGAISIAAYVATLTLHNQQLQIEKNRANAAQEFLIDLLRSADPYAPANEERGSNITVVEALDIGVERLRSGLYEDPTLKASLLISIAEVYVSLDKHQQAIALREEALLLQRELHGDTSELVIQSVRALANQYRTIGDYVHADTYYTEQLALARSRYSHAEPELGVAEAASAAFQLSRGERTLSEQLMQDGISKMRRKPSEFARPLINAEAKLASLRLGKMRDETLAMLVGTQQLADSTAGPDSLLAAFVHAQTATSLSSYGEYEAAEEQFKQAIDIYESRAGRTHGATLAALNNLGLLYVKTQRFDLAEDIHRELLQTYLAKYGPKHRGVAESYQNLATVIGRQGRLDESLPLHRLALESYRAVLNEDNPSIAIPLLSIASAELKLGNASEAEVAAQEALDWFRSTAAAGSTLEGIALCLVGVSLEGQGKAAEGSAMVENASLLIKPGEAPETYRALCRLAGQ